MRTDRDSGQGRRLTRRCGRGSTAQIEAFTSIIDASCDDYSSEPDSDFVVEPVALGPESSLVGCALAETGMRSRGCMVISVVRDGHIITNPRPDFIFQTGDIVYLAGERPGVAFFQN